MASTAPSGKTISYLSKLFRSTDGGSTYGTTYYDIFMLKPPSPTMGVADVTVLDSPFGVKEKLAGWGDNGVVPFSGYFTKAQYASLLAVLQAGVSYYWKVALPLLSGETNPSNWIFQAILTKFEFSEGKAGEDQAYSFDGELTITSGTGFGFTAAT